MKTLITALTIILTSCSLLFAKEYHMSVKAEEPSRAKFADGAAVVCFQKTSPLETLAAREVSRYVYQRTGKRLPILTQKPPLRFLEDAIVIGRKDRDGIGSLLQEPQLRADVAALQAQQYILKTIQVKGRRILLVVGGDEIGTLYGAYRLAECLGVRFYVHGDVIPDEPIRFELPNLDEQDKPLFAFRGILPFHDFAFGPDWWTTEDYKAHIAQLVKMRMNFIGFHCYPEYSDRTSLPEPTVWMGLKGDFDEQGRVRVGYPTGQRSTMSSASKDAEEKNKELPVHPGGGLGVSMRTSDYKFGADILFDRDDAGSEARAVAALQADPGESQNVLLNHCGAMYREAFGWARALGLKTCVGTEVPLTRVPYMMPSVLLDRIKAQGRDPGDPAVLQEVYEAMFLRIVKTHPLDYFWLWTSEFWRDGNKPEDIKMAIDHFTAAHRAIQRVGAPFKLATAGWVLGPQEDRAAYDKILPKDVAVSSINDAIGFKPVEPAYASIQGREKWVIPWMEDDLALANPQLWVGRIRKDAADALAYGCTGLFGIHWRTKVIAPNFAALAQAGWSQSSWNPTPGKVPPSVAQGMPYGKEPLTERFLGSPRGLGTADFYADWARANFGDEAASEIAAIFERIDGNLPRVLHGCPCGLNPDKRPWNQVAGEYGFVDALEKYRKKAKGAGDLARFDYWLNWLRHLRAAGAMECAIGHYDKVMADVNAEQDPVKRKELARTLALPAYREIYRRYCEAFNLLLQVTNSAGELGAVAVWQQNYYPAVIENRQSTLSKALGEPLPTDLEPTRQYNGPPRLIVPTIRGIAVEGEEIPLRIIVLSQKPPQKQKLHWRVIGTGEYAVADLQHVARGVYSALLPPMPAAGIEYFIEVTTDDAQKLVFPATAPKLNQTITAMPGGGADRTK